MKLIALSLAVILTGCVDGPVSSSAFATRDARIRARMSFHKHPNGLCFAVVTFDRSMSVTNIPCQSGDTVFVR